MKEIQFGAVFPESGVLKFAMEVKYVMVIVTFVPQNYKSRSSQNAILYGEIVVGYVVACLAYLEAPDSILEKSILSLLILAFFSHLPYSSILELPIGRKVYRLGTPHSCQ